MSLGKQSKVLSKKQVTAVSGYLRGRRNGLRNETVFLLSAKAGLRAKEIAELKWSMVLESDDLVCSPRTPCAGAGMNSFGSSCST